MWKNSTKIDIKLSRALSNIAKLETFYCFKIVTFLLKYNVL